MCLAEITEAVQTLKDTGSNIFVAICHGNECLEILKAAAARGLLERGYAWIVSDTVYVDQVRAGR